MAALAVLGAVFVVLPGAPVDHDVGVDLRDEAAGREALGALSGVSHVDYAAV
jgi:hypothetical protein